MGMVDVAIRIVIASTIGLLYFTDQLSGITSIILLGFSAILILTSFIGTCPLYLPLGLSTRKE